MLKVGKVWSAVEFANCPTVSDKGVADVIITEHAGPRIWTGDSWESFVNFCDLSPLSNFIKSGEGICETWGGHTAKVIYIGDCQPGPIADPDPIQREIDKMMEKRKAKRENAGPQSISAEDYDKFVKQRKVERERQEALDRACSKLTFHSLTIGDRLSAYRGPELGNK